MSRLLVVLTVLVGIAGLLLYSAGRADPPAATSPTLPYGLKGDGQSDDTVALQRALAAGSVRLPRGIYRISKPIVLELDRTGYVGLQSDGTAQILMTGPGPALHLIGSHAGTAAPQTVQPAVWHKQRTPMIDGIEIVGAHPEADGIRAEGIMQLTITRTVLRQCRHGIHLVKRNRNVLISACHIYQNRGIGVFLDQVNLHQINIDGCHISYCDGGGVVSRGGEVRNLHLGTCDIESNMSVQGPPTANVLLDCTQGSIAEVAITGCTIQHNDKGKDSANIRILGQGRALRPGGTARWGHVTITGNVLSDVQHNIDLDGARGVTITGNTFWMAYQYNLRAVRCEQLVVTGNVFERNPAYDYGTSLTTRNALLFDRCKDCTLSGLQIHEVRAGVPAALRLSECDRCNLVGLTILDCECTGLSLHQVTNSRVSDCLIQSKDKQLTLEITGGKNLQVCDNLLQGNARIDAEALRKEKSP
jgi:hypothetical protein